MAETTQVTEEKNEEKQNQQNDTTQEDSKVQAKSAEFPEASATENTGVGTSIDILLDMNVPVTVTIGKTEISIQQLLQLGQGSVLKLDKSIDTPVDLYLKDTKFASGNVVVVEDRFAVRIKDVFVAEDTVNTNKE